jgi:Uncharacterized alpha/beta hydrolase domain (DUF2235)
MTRPSSVLNGRRPWPLAGRNLGECFEPEDGRELVRAPQARLGARNQPAPSSAQVPAPEPAPQADASPPAPAAAVKSDARPVAYAYARGQDRYEQEESFEDWLNAYQPAADDALPPPRPAPAPAPAWLAAATPLAPPTFTIDLETDQGTTRLDYSATQQTFLAPPPPVAAATATAAPVSAVATAGSPPATGTTPSTGPSASPQEITCIELLLADPINREIVALYGGGVPALGDNATSRAVIEHYGFDLAGRIQQLSQGLAGVRAAYLQAYDSAAQNPGADSQGAHSPGSVFVAGSAMGGDSDPVPAFWAFDPVLFTQQYAQGSSPAQRLFAALHAPDSGASALSDLSDLMGGQTTLIRPNSYRDSDSVTTFTLNGGFAFQPGAWQNAEHHPNRAERMQWAGASISSELLHVNPATPPALHDPGMVWFDPQLGFVTSPDNRIVPKDRLGDLFAVVCIGFMTWGTCGALGVAGGAGMGAATTTGGAIAAGAAFGAVGTAYGGLINNGKLNLRDIFKGALTGAVTAGITQSLNLSTAGVDASTGQVTSYGLRAMAITGQASLQGALQELSGGKFADGFTAGMASGLGAEVARQINLHIEGELQQQLSVEQADMLRTFSKVIKSAITLLAKPSDPSYAFAQDFVSGLVQDVQGAATASELATQERSAGLLNQSSAETARLERFEAQARDGEGARQSDEILARRGWDAGAPSGGGAVTNEPRPVLSPTPATITSPVFRSTAFDDDGHLMPGVIDLRATAAQQQQQLTRHLMDQGLSLAQADALTWRWASQETGNSSNPLSTNGPDGEPRPQGPADWYTERAADGSPARRATAHEIARLENVMQRIRETDFVKVFDPVANPDQKLFHVSFDGTWNNRDKQTVATNPAELQRLMEAPPGNDGKSIYKTGIGTQGWPRNVVDGSVNAGAAATRIVSNAYEELSNQVRAWKQENPNTEVVVSLAGFSRGGAQALNFANKLQNEGVPDPRNPGQFLIAPGAIKLGPMMLYDPVDMSGKALNVAVPTNASSVLVLAAGSEYRSSFPAVGVVDPNNPTDPRITRIELPGTHTDNGRGYDHGIGNYTLQMGRDYLSRSGVPIAELPNDLKPGNAPVLVHDSLTDGFGNRIWEPRAGGRETINAPNPAPKPSPRSAPQPVDTTDQPAPSEVQP